MPLQDKDRLRFEVIRSAKRFSNVGIHALLAHINSLVAEKSCILVDRPYTLKQEKEWRAGAAKDVQAGKHRQIICWDGKKIAGIADARKGSFKERQNVSLGVAVAKGYRGRGVGKKLLELAILEAKKTMKARYIWLEYQSGNNAAKNLYKKMGFVECARLPGFINHYGRYCDKVFMKYLK